MSEITYNGIGLKLVRTNLIARDNVYSPDGSDLLHTRHTFDVECVYNPGATSFAQSAGVPQPTNNSLPPDTDNAIREKLLENRKPFTYAVNGKVVLQSPAPGFTVDAVNGPRPIHCHVLKMHSTKTWIVSYRIETDVNECTPPDQADPFLSNRWETAHSVDDQDMTVITTSGVCVVRSDALSLTPSKNADAFRSRCLPPVPLGFQRKSISARVNPVGNVLTWQTVDVQMFYSLGATNPFGVRKFEAVYTQSSNPVDNNGTQSIFDGATLDIRVWGNVNATRYNLTLWAIKVAIERLKLKAGPAVAGTVPLIRGVNISEQMHDRIIDFRISVQLPVAKVGAVGAAAINGQFLGVDLKQTLANNNLNPQMASDLNSRGTYTGEAFAAALQSACSVPQVPKYAPGQSNNGNVAPLSQYQPPAVDVQKVPSLATQPTRYGDATISQGAYTEYRVNAEWDNDSGVSMMKVAGDDDAKPVFVKLYSSAKTITYTWSVERNGTKPALPTPDHGDRRMVLLRSRVRPTEIYLAPDGVTPIYRVEGQYKYGLNIKGNEDFAIPFPTVPWTNFAFGAVAVTPGDFVHLIIDPIPPVRPPSPGNPTGPGDPDPAPPGYPSDPPSGPIDDPDPPPTEPTSPSPGGPSPGDPKPGDPPTIDPPANPTGEY